jgi:hypothetical protein
MTLAPLPANRRKRKFTALPMTAEETEETEEAGSLSEA